jgi:class 3 adenylate cyclase/tetratricopeptide (TPR) repeat protein
MAAMTRVLPTGRVTFAFIDVVGSTRLLAEHGAAFVEALGRLHDLVTRHATAHAGMVVKTEGDGAFLAFSDADRAVGALIGLQDDLRAGDVFDDLPWLTVRAGAHTGEAVPVDDDYVAYAVNVAARVASAANSGQVLVSSACADDLTFSGEQVGLFELKDVAEPQLLWRVCGDTTSPRAAPARRTNVAVARSSFVGRDADLDLLARLLGEHRLLTVVGTGGLGKTRLVSELALRECKSFDHGAWLVELASITDPAQVPYTVGAALGMAEAGDIAAVVEELNARGELLLILDNCEHLVDAAAETATTLLEECPQVRLLCTSREPLLLDGEKVHRPAALARSADTRSAGPAEELFVQRAQQNGVRVDPIDLTHVTMICDLYDGLPLAIELAAAQSATPLPALARALADRQVELRRRGTSSRQSGLDAMVRWSLGLLTGPERNTMLALTIFPGRFTPAMASAVIEPLAGVGPDGTTPTLEALVRKSLVDLDGDELRLLVTIKDCCAGELASRPDVERIARDALLTWAQELAGSGVHTPPDIPELNRDTAAALEAAFVYGWRHGRAPLGSVLRALGDWGARHGFSSSLIELAAELVGRCRLETVDDLRLYRCAAFQHLNHHDACDLSRSDDALATARRLRDGTETFWLLQLNSWKAATSGGLEEALRLLAEADELIRHFPDLARYEATVAASLGEALSLAARHEEALHQHLRSVELATRDWGSAHEVYEMNVGACYLELGDPKAAVEHLRAARRANVNVDLDACMLTLLARASVMLHDWARARTYAVRAVEVLRPSKPDGVSPMEHFLAMAEAVLAEVAVETGQITE